MRYVLIVLVATLASPCVAREMCGIKVDGAIFKTLSDYCPPVSVKEYLKKLKPSLRTVCVMDGKRYAVLVGPTMRIVTDLTTQTGKRCE